MLDRRLINLEAYLRSKVQIRNLTGSRGYEHGIRTFDCPLCGDTKGRGWLSVSGWGAGCFNVGCVAEPSLDGGAIEWVRRAQRFISRAEVYRYLEQRYQLQRPIQYKAVVREPGKDYCRFPTAARQFDLQSSPMQKVFEDFIKQQWSISLNDARSWGLCWCLQGDYAWRVIIPILIGGVPVAFQARTIKQGMEPKYRTSEIGKECARPAAELLFNIDAVVPDEDVVLVEGLGDVMGWHKGGNRARDPIAVAILGVALTPEKCAMLKAKRPGRIIVGLDDEPAAQQRALQHIETLGWWGFPTAFGRWLGAKDAGAGATLEIQEPDGDLLAMVRQRLLGR